MNDLAGVPYLDGGRTWAGADCWGLAMLVRERLGLPDVPLAAGTTRGTMLAMQSEFQRVSQALVIGDPKPGALAAVFKRKAFVHVGVVVEADGRLWVVDANPGHCSILRRLADFNHLYSRVVYYRDSDLPEPPGCTGN